MMLTLARHLFAVLAGWIVAFFTAKGVALDPAQLSGVMLAIYVLIEKMLKPVTVNAGEIQPGAVAATTTKVEKVKVAVIKAAKT